MTKKRTENSFVVEWKDGRLRLVASRGAARQLLLAALLVMAAVFVSIGLASPDSRLWATAVMTVAMKLFVKLISELAVAPAS
jgi:hypothetical protein